MMLQGLREFLNITPLAATPGRIEARWTAVARFPPAVSTGRPSTASVDPDPVLSGRDGFGEPVHYEEIMPTHDEIYQKIQATLVDALGVDEDQVQPEATLFNDLGAESIDLLDIVFRLERNFGIKIPRGELFPENVSDPELTQDGKLTAKGLEEMRQRLPFVDLTEFAENPEVDKLLNLYTVDMLVKYVASKLND
jgi:acyl carrier protein